MLALQAVRITLAPPNAMDPKKQPGLELGQIVLERVLFEHRPDYLTLPHTTTVPSLPLRIHAQLGLGVCAIGGSVYNRNGELRQHH